MNASLRAAFPIRSFVLAVVLAVVAGAALSAPTFDNRSLRGVYKFNMAEIRYEFVGSPPVKALDHCSSFGVAEFDGAGNFTVSSTRRCEHTGTITETNTMTYSVQPNGEVLFFETPATDPTHGVIVNNGKAVLIDSTTRTDPDAVSQNGIAFKD